MIKFMDEWTRTRNLTALLSKKNLLNNFERSFHGKIKILYTE